MLEWHSRYNLLPSDWPPGCLWAGTFAPGDLVKDRSCDGSLGLIVAAHDDDAFGCAAMLYILWSNPPGTFLVGNTKTIVLPKSVPGATYTITAGKGSASTSIPSPSFVTTKAKRKCRKKRR